MIKNWAIQNTEWLLLVVMSALLIWLIFIWKERSKYPNLKFFTNSFIALIAITALSLLILKPLKFASSKPFKVVIITKNFKKKQLDSLKNTYENLVTYNYNPENKLLEDSSIPDTVFILGNGVKSYDLWQLDSIKTKYIGGNNLKGIINLNYYTQNKVGKQAIFKGKYLNAQKGHKLLLETPDKKSVDSITLTDKKEQKFQLATNLNVQGNYVYHLTEKDSLGVVINTNPLPISVSSNQNLKLLIINDFPTFETKYLKNFLADQGHEVTIRSQITKNRFKYEYFNTSTKSTIELSQQQLKSFDLLIINNSVLRKLSRNKQDNIKRAVKDNGLGVFIQSDASFFSQKNNLATFKFNRDKTNFSTLSQWPRTRISTYNQSFKNELSLQSIHISNSKIVSAYRQLGLGRIGSSSFKNTYALRLNGNDKIYRAIWSEIIEKVSKKNTTIVEWDSESLFAFIDEPFIFDLSTQTPLSSVIDRDSIPLAMKQNMDIMSLWEGVVRPKKLGWNSLRLEQDTNAVFNYFVAENSDWKSLQSYQTIKSNQRRFGQPQDLKKGTLKSAEPINRLWPFMVFIIGVGYLWLEPKL